MKISPAAIILGLLVGHAAMADGPEPVIMIRVDHPERQLESVIALFRGAKAPHPAAALAAWKRASLEPSRLGKPLEALIAAINPRMVDELRTFDAAEVAIRFNPEGGPLDWWVTLPNDDGTFAALASAMVLSGGLAEAPLDDLPVDRLGGPGSAMMARSPRGVLLSGTREGLKAALSRPGLTGDLGPRRDSGWVITLNPQGMGDLKTLAGRRLAEAIRATGCRDLSAVSSLEGSTVAAAISGKFGAIPGEAASVDPSWLDWVPANRAMAAMAVAVDPRAEVWDAFFALADRIERVDPSRSEMAPIRLRLGLAARVFGVRLEADVLAHLRGVTIWVGSRVARFDGGLLALHLNDEAAAVRLIERVASRPVADAGAVRQVGEIAGRSVRMSRRGATALIAWGEGALEASLEARDRPGFSAGPALRTGWNGPLPSRAGGFWPGRLPGLMPEGSPLAVALADAPPILWIGHRTGHLVTDRLSWANLDTTVKRFLDLIPLDPPPDR